MQKCSFCSLLVAAQLIHLCLMQDILKCHKLSRFIHVALIVFLEFILWLTCFAVIGCLIINSDFIEISLPFLSYFRHKQVDEKWKFEISLSLRLWTIHEKQRWRRRRCSILVVHANSFTNASLHWDFQKSLFSPCQEDSNVSIECGIFIERNLPSPRLISTQKKGEWHEYYLKHFLYTSRESKRAILKTEN